MCKTKLHPFLRALPKCEHHIHIEGSLEPPLLFSLAKRNNIALPQDDEAYSSQDALLARYKRFTSLDDFLGYYYIGMSVLIHAADFEALAWEYFSKVSHQGLQHAEIFFDAQAHTARGIAYSTMIDGFTSAKERAERELGITSLFICCFLRHIPLPESIALFDHPDVQASFSNRQVVGIGIDSSETPYPPYLFRELFEKASNLGLHRTAHAGEEGPVEYIKDALKSLGIERIDHGLRLADDLELMTQVAQSQTLLSLCPLSNVQLKCVDTLADVPIRKLLDAGVKFSINSDGNSDPDPAYFGGNYILDNYCAVQEQFNLSVAEWEGICRAGIVGSWCSQHRKDEMLAMLQRLAGQWQEH